MLRIALLLFVASCKIRNEQSCEIADNKNNPECSDALTACTDSAQCAPDVCDTTAGICVECLVDGDCEGQVCNASHVCEPCDAHSDCESHACDFVAGTCLDDNMVAYITQGGTGTGGMGCTIDDPCPSIAEAMLAGKPNIKFEGTTKVTVANEQEIAANVRILADPGAALARTTDGIILRVNDVTVAIEDLEIREGGSSSGDAIFVEGGAAKLTLDRVFLVENEGRGVNANAGEVVMRRSIVAFNENGGLSLQSRFAISNSIIVLNGGSTSQIGGVRVSTENSASTFNFNTVANNLTDANNTGQAAMNCDLGNFTATSNIVAVNVLDTGCNFDFSLFNGVAVGNGNNNKAGDPMFASVMLADLRAMTFYRIKTGSQAIDGADPAQTEAVDIDGDPRPAAKDMGADEFVP